jgi:hypothetical protein
VNVKVLEMVPPAGVLGYSAPVGTEVMETATGGSRMIDAGVIEVRRPSVASLVVALIVAVPVVVMGDGAV